MKSEDSLTSEEQRLQCLYKYQILDTEPEPVFDDLILLAANICEIPYAAMSLVDKERQWFKSALGFEDTETPRGVAFSHYTIQQNTPFEVVDTHQDKRFSEHPFVTAAPMIRYYFGVPIIVSKTIIIGSLCLFNDKPVTLSPNQKQAVVIISKQISAQLDLRYSSQKLMKANDFRQHFLAHIAHQIRTPINSLLGTLQLILDSDLSENQRSLTGLSISSAEAVFSVINDNIALSAIEDSRIKLQPTVFILDDLINEISRTFRSKAERKNIELLCPANYIPELKVTADPLRLRQVISQLIDNAIKFTDQGEVKVQVWVELIADALHEIRFEIIDTGSGLSLMEQEQLLQRASYIDLTTKFSGQGVGLIIVRQLVEFMKGQLGLSSHRGKGSTFWFSILAHAVKAENKEKLTVAKLKVLLLHHSRGQCQLLADVMKNWSVQYQIEMSPDQALLSLRLGFESGAPFDLVLIDEKLQWTGGESLPERLQRDGTLSIVKRVMFGYSSQIRTDKQVPYYHRILLHPISQSELYNCLLELGCDSSATSVKPIKSNFPTFKAQVLIVEDNKINQVVAKGLLEKFGVEVDIADHGEHALEKLINKRYELIFMDCQMPVMDGYQATGHIRQLQEGLTATAVPIVALSANAMKGDEENCLKAGMDDYIAKPVSPAALEQALRRWLPPENELSRT